MPRPFELSIYIHKHMSVFIGEPSMILCHLAALEGDFFLTKSCTSIILVFI